MAFRIYKTRTRKEATEELLAILAQHPEGLSTSQLSGTPKFHGGRTLSNRQIIRLLRESGRVRESIGGQGTYNCSWWRLACSKSTRTEWQFRSTSTLCWEK